MADKAQIAKPKGKAAKPVAQVQRKEQSRATRAERTTSTSNFLNSIGGNAVQAKVKVGPANDKYEQEADSMADKVMRSAEPSVQAKHQSIGSLAIGADGTLQKKESETEEQEITQVQTKPLTKATGGDSPNVQKKEIGSDNPNRDSLRNKVSRMPQARTSFSSVGVHRKEEDEEVQKKSGSDTGRGPPVGGDFSSKLSQSKGGGQSMDGSTQSFMGSRFGADFSNVRIHTGSNAAQMSDSINAKAFTHQNDIYFNQGQYQPETHSGKTLLAHELTHTIQQGAVNGGVQAKLKVGAPDDKYEKEADATAAQVMRMPLENEVERKCAACENEEKIQRSSLSDRGPPSAVIPSLSNNYSSSQIQRQAWEKEYSAETENIQRKELASSIQTRAGPGIVQRGLWDYVSDAVDYVVDAVEDTLDAGIDWVKEQLDGAASRVPGYMLLTVVLGENPITGSDVERNGRNFLEAGLDVIPNGDDYKRKMQEDGGYDDAVNWIDEQLELIDFSISDVARDFGNFIDGLDASDIASPGAALERGIAVFDRYVSRIITFAQNVALKLLEIVKDIAVNALLEWIREETPWYPLLTVILGEDPITGEEVERNGMNILSGFILLHPEGEEQLRQMEESGSLQKASDWVDEAIVRVTRIAAGIKNGFLTMWEEFTITKLLTPVETFQEVYALFETPVTELIDFALEVAGMILQFIKDALIARLIEFARTIPGYTLVTVILGKDIFSEEPVDRSAKNIIKGFMELVPGGTEKFNELDQTGAIDDAIAWIEGAIEELDLTWEAVVLLFTTAWNEFSLADLATPIETFQRVMDLFAAPIGRVIRFVGKVIFKLVEIALRLMGFPFELIGSIIQRAQTAYEEIKRDPIQFLKNILRAVKQGFIQFFENILQHLLNGVGEWLFGQLGDTGITIPTDFSFPSILQMVFEILGVTRERIFEKIREKVGPERWARIEGAIDTLTGIWTFVSDVVTRGPIAIWEKIQEQLSNLWTMVIDAAKNWIMTRIIQQVTVRLLSMLDPTGIMAVVNSFLVFFNAVQSAIQYMIPMLEMLNSFLGGVVQIAQGNIQPAADLLERTMAQGMPILIGFLANQVGLGGIGRRIGEVIQSLQERVDNGIQWLIDRAWEIGAGLLEMGRNAVGAVTEWWNSRRAFNAGGEQHSLYFRGGESNARLIVASDPKTIDQWLTDREAELRGANEFSGAKSAAHGRIKDQLVPELHAATNPPNGTPAAGARSPDQIMGDITTEIQTVGMGIEEGPPVPPMAVNPGFSNSQATSMTAQNIYDGPGNHQDGSPTTGSELSDEFTALAGMGLGGGFWVRFHLINEEIGGRAVDSNLVPLPQQLNRQYSAEFEEPLKNLYRGDQANDVPKKPVWYNINLIYWRSDPRWLRSINVRGGKMKPSGNTWVNDRGLSPWSRTNIAKPTAGTGVSINSFISSTSPDIPQVARDTGLFNRTLQLLHRRGTALTSINEIETIIDAQTSAEWTDDRKSSHISKFEQVRDAGRIQLKSKAKKENSPAEKEADQMADAVVQRKELEDLPVLPADKKRQEENKVEGGIMKLLGHKIQAKCKDCEEEKVQRKCAKCDEESVQRKANGNDTGNFSSQLNASRGRGSPMDSSTRGFMEGRFGTNFGNVKIHTDHEAVAMNEKIHAKAFTHKNNIYFNQGEYNPAMESGKHLLAHELTHTIQQGAVSESSANLAQRKCTDCEHEVQRSEGGPEYGEENYDTGYDVSEEYVEEDYAEEEPDYIPYTCSQVKSFYYPVVINNFHKVLKADGDIGNPEFIENLKTDIIAVELSLTTDEASKVKSATNALDSVTAMLQEWVLDYAYSVLWLKYYLGLPPELVEIGGERSYGLQHYIREVSDEISGYLTHSIADNLTPQEISCSIYTLEDIKTYFQSYVTSWGGSDGLLEMEFIGTMNGLVELQQAFGNPENSTEEQIAYGTEIGKVSRQLLLLDMELEGLRAQLNDGEASYFASNQSELEEYLTDNSSRISSLRETALTEGDTFEVLNDELSLLRDSAIEKMPSSALLNYYDSVTISPDSAFPEATDNATLDMMYALSNRIDEQQKNVASLKEKVIPSSPTYQPAEFVKVYEQWFAFFSPKARDMDPFYMQMDALVSQIYAIFGMAGAEGGIGRWMLMEKMMPLVTNLGGANATSFATTIAAQNDGRSHTISGTASSVEYNFAELYKGSDKELNFDGEQQSVDSAISREKSDSVKGFNTLREMRAMGFARAEISKTAAKKGLVPNGIEAPIFLLPKETHQDDWSYLITTPIMNTSGGYFNIHEQQVMQPEMTEYLMSKTQYYETLKTNHLPSVGDAYVRGEGIEAGRASNQSTYLEGGVQNEAMNEADGYYSNINSAKSSARISGSKSLEYLATSRIISELEAYLGQYFKENEDVVERLFGVLHIGVREHNADRALLKHFEPLNLAKAVAKMAGLVAFTAALRFIPYIGYALSFIVGRMLKKYGISSDIGDIIAIVGFIAEVENANSFFSARQYGYFSKFMLNDLGTLLQGMVVSSGLNAFKAYKGLRRTTQQGTIDEVMKDLEPVTKDPELKAELKDFLTTRKDELANNGGTKNPELELINDILLRLDGGKHPDKAISIDAAKLSDIKSGDSIVKADTTVTVGGEKHGMSITVMDGKLVVRICSDCEALLRAITFVADLPVAKADPDVMQRLSQIAADTRLLNETINGDPAKLAAVKPQLEVLMGRIRKVGEDNPEILKVLFDTGGGQASSKKGLEDLMNQADRIFEPSTDRSPASDIASRVKQTPSPLKGTWTGERGESKFIPDDVEVMKVLQHYGVDGIVYRNGYPDFTPVVVDSVKISAMGSDRTKNLDDLATEAFAQKWKVSKDRAAELIRGMDVRRHESEDLTSVMLIDRIVHEKFGHYGGVSEAKRRDWVDP